MLATARAHWGADTARARTSMFGLDRATMLRLTAASLAGVWQPSVGHAWCGGDFPGQLAWDESLLSLDSGEVLTRLVGVPAGGNGQNRILQNRVTAALRTTNVDSTRLAPVLVVGVPGLPFDYLENLETLAISGRPILFVGTCGSATPAKEADGDGEEASMSGATSRPSPALSVEVAAQQLLAACEARRLSGVHVIAHGLGAPAALRLVSLLEQQQQQQQQQPSSPSPRVLSLCLASPFGSIDDLTNLAARRIRDLADIAPQDDPMPTEGYACVVEASMLTGLPWRRLLIERPASTSAARLGRAQLASRLPREAPTLLVHGGSADPVTCDWEFRQGGAQPKDVIVYRRSGHLPWIDERESFLCDVLDFIDGVDSVTTPRVGLVNINTRYSL